MKRKPSRASAVPSPQPLAVPLAPSSSTVPAPAPVSASNAASTAGSAECPSATALLQQLELCAAGCAEVQRVLGGRGTPELETIIRLHRLLILRFSLEAAAAPEMLKIVDTLMKPVMDWARLEEKRKEREIDEQRYRDKCDADRKAEQSGAIGTGQPGTAPGSSPLRPETLEQIEQELSLL